MMMILKVCTFSADRHILNDVFFFKSWIF